MKSALFAALYQTSATIGNHLGNKRKFMNLGYAGESSLDVQAIDKVDTHHISLYMKLLDMIPGCRENGKNWSALEVGCGRGGGCYVMKKYFHIPDITGVDLSSANIKIATKLVHSVDFISSDAITFTTPKKFDIILNLESSHRYSSRLAFFKKVASMMKIDAYFVFGDMIRKHELEEVEKMFQESGLKIIKVETANEGVVNSIKQNSPKQYPVATTFPFLFPKRIHSFCVTIHSIPFNKLKNGEVLYNLYLLKKA